MISVPNKSINCSVNEHLYINFILDVLTFDRKRDHFNHKPLEKEISFFVRVTQQIRQERRTSTGKYTFYL